MSLRASTPDTLPRSAGRSAFGKDPAGYHAARSGYPKDLFEVIAKRSRCRSILEIGAGTGLATRSLLDLSPDRLVAIEPDPALADYLQKRINDRRLEVRAPGFGDSPISETFDLVAAASSFHWLEPEAALSNVHAALAPGGLLALWWNSYRQPNSGDPFTDAVAPLLDGVTLAPSETQFGHYSLDEAFHRNQLTEAGFREIEFHVFRSHRWIGGSEARALFASYSFVSALPPERRDRLLVEVERVVEDRFGGRCPNQVISALYTARAS